MMNLFRENASPLVDEIQFAAAPNEQQFFKRGRVDGPLQEKYMP
jgi:hypothetical protein